MLQRWVKAAEESEPSSSEGPLNDEERRELRRLQRVEGHFSIPARFRFLWLI